MSFNCLDCKIVISNTSGSLGGPITFTDPFTGLSNVVSYPYFEPGEVAKYSNLFWIKCPDTVQGGEQIKRFVIITNQSGDCLVQHADAGPASKIWNSIKNQYTI